MRDRPRGHPLCRFGRLRRRHAFRRSSSDPAGCGRQRSSECSATAGRAVRAKTGIEITPSFGASGQLAAQIKQGAPFDIFLSANQSFVDDLAAQGLIDPKSVRPYARGSLVLAVYREVADEIHSLEDLAKPAVKKIALANPDTAPYGKAGKQAFERAGLFKQLEPKIVLAESVAQALIYAQKGDAEAALIGRAIARAPRYGSSRSTPAYTTPSSRRSASSVNREGLSRLVRLQLSSSEKMDRAFWLSSVWRKAEVRLSGECSNNDCF